MSLLYYHHPICEKHEMLPGHAERPDRLRAIDAILTTSGLKEEFDCRLAPALDLEQIGRTHRPAYVEAVAEASPAEGLVALDPDTAMCPHSLEAARRAAGAVTDAVSAVIAGDARRAFCAVRPPGHHAERDVAMGFCLFNSVAIGADLALTATGIDRVAVLDFDVHHGNGTVDIFKDRPEVLVCSSFQHPYYPHRYFDIDRPNIVNTPLPAGTASNAFHRALEADWLPALEAHRPDLILVSAGFDAHRDDPLAQLELIEADYTWVTELIVAAANATAEGRIVSTLEGGYDLNALARSVQAHLEALSD